jgi:hypothetical protein
MGEHDDDLETSTVPESRRQHDVSDIATAVVAGFDRLASAVERGLGELASAVRFEWTRRPKSSNRPAGRSRLGRRRDQGDRDGYAQAGVD